MDKIKTVLMTPSEERFFCMSSFYPDSCAFNEAICAKFNFVFEKNTLQIAVNAMQNYHDVLGASVCTDNEQISLRINQKTPNSAKLDYVESRLHNFDIDQFASDYVSAAFNIYEPPLFRICLIQFENSSIIIMSMHHLISDGFPTFKILLNDLIKFYTYLKANKKLELLNCNISQRSSLSESMLNNMFDQNNTENNIKFWKSYLKNSYKNNSFSRLLVPQQLLKNNCYSYPYSSDSVKIAFEIDNFSFDISKIRDLSKLNNENKYEVFFISSLFSLLKEYSDDKDINLGIPEYSRDIGADRMLGAGYYGNVFIISSDITSALPLKDILDNYLRVKKHSKTPFQQIVQSICPNWRTVSRTPLFNVLFTMNLCKNNNDYLFLPCDLKEIQYDIIFSSIINPYNSIILKIDFNKEFYDKNKMEKLIKKWKQILYEQIIEYKG